MAKRRTRRMPPRHKSGPHKGQFMKRGSVKHRARRKSNPARRRVRRSSRRVRHSNPIRRGYHRRSAARRSNPSHRRRRRSYSRNPIRLGNLGSMLTNAAIGATGAVIVDNLVKRLPLPATLMSGNMAYITKSGLAVLLGVVANMAGPKVGRIGAKMAEGSLLVTVYQAINNVVLPMVPGLQGLGYWGSGYTVATDQGGPSMAGLGYSGAGEYVGAMAGMHGMGEYVH
jgi:hypothetical protein